MPLEARAGGGGGNGESGSSARDGWDLLYRLVGAWRVADRTLSVGEPAGSTIPPKGLGIPRNSSLSFPYPSPRHPPSPIPPLCH